MQPGPGQLLVRIYSYNPLEGPSPPERITTTALMEIVRAIDLLLIEAVETPSRPTGAGQRPRPEAETIFGPPWVKRRFELTLRTAGPGSFEMLFDLISHPENMGAWLTEWASTPEAQALALYTGIAGGVAGVAAGLGAFCAFVGALRRDEEAEIPRLSPRTVLAIELLVRWIGVGRGLDMVTQDARQELHGPTLARLVEHQERSQPIDKPVAGIDAIVLAQWGPWLEIRRGYSSETVYCDDRAFIDAIFNGDRNLVGSTITFDYMNEEFAGTPVIRLYSFSDSSGLRTAVDAREGST